MTLAFGSSITLGSLRYDSHTIALRLTLALAPRAGSAQIVLPAGVRVDAGPGDAAAVVLHGEEADVPTFAGVVLRVDRSLGQTSVTAGDALARLAAVRPGSTFEQQSAADVIRNMADAAAIPTGSLDASTDLLAYVADQGRTALEHTARLAEWAGSFATSDAEGALELRPFPTGPADLALRYGREIATLQVRVRQPEPDVVWSGSGPAGNVSAPDAHLQTTRPLPDGVPAPGPRTVRVAAPSLRTAAAATAAGESTARRNAGARLRATCWLQPVIRPGMSIEIADAPRPDASGPWFVTSVVHEVGPGGRGVTFIEADALTAGGGPFAGLLGAVGGLL